MSTGMGLKVSHKPHTEHLDATLKTHEKTEATLQKQLYRKGGTHPSNSYVQWITKDAIKKQGDDTKKQTKILHEL